MTLGDFSRQADSYVRSRPSYPIELLDLLIADAKIHSGENIADFGAGTGIMTKLLADRGFVVSAIEPNDSMRKRANVPAAHWVAGTFEESHLESQSQRWAIAAQAFHWADPPRCLPEIRRILQPDCLLTLVWNDRVKSENSIVSWTENAIRQHVPEFDEAYRERPWNEILESTGDFRFLKQRTMHHSIPMSRDRFLELWRSHNRLNTIAGPNRFAKFFADLVSHLDEHQCDQIEVQYACRAWSAVRID
jgi:ubiquinone/menaquinone biosynthesis C-methylase UbiE